MDSKREKVGGGGGIGVVYGKGVLHLVQSFLEADEIVSEIVHIRVRAYHNLHTQHGHNVLPTS